MLKRWRRERENCYKDFDESFLLYIWDLEKLILLFSFFTVSVARHEDWLQPLCYNTTYIFVFDNLSLTIFIFIKLKLLLKDLTVNH